MKTRISRSIFTLFALSGFLVAGGAPAMGTPPQKAGKTVSEVSSNAVMIKTDDVRAAPDSGASVLARADKGARVFLLASQGGWSRISHAGKTGWVRVLSVSADSREGVTISDLGALGKTPQGKVVAVAGVRGLDEDILKSASYSEAEIVQLHGYVASRLEAEKFAQTAGLKARAMPYFSSSPEASDATK